MLNLLKDGKVVKQVQNGSSLNYDGIYVSPAYAGWSHGDYELVEAPPVEPTAPDLESTRASALSTVDSQAEQQRLIHITPGVGQSMTYARKVEEAKAFLVDPEGDYPMLSASVGIDGDNMEQVAQIVLNLDYQWSLIGAHIESVRLAAKAEINAATTVEEIEAILANVNWQSA